MSLAGRYEILGECGQGAHGVVYRARERSTGRHVAIKVLRDPADALDTRRAHERLRREAAALDRIRHPGVVSIVEVSVSAEGACLVTEFVDGGTLRDLLAERGRLAPEEAVSVVAQAARALAAAHARGLVHRDIKPANLLVAADGSIKVTDFGVAVGADLQPLVDERDYFCGTPAYVAPEVLEGAPVGPVADIYSLGAVFYECLTGRRPFEGASVRETLHRVLRGHPESPTRHVPSLPAATADLCLAALSRAPADRPSSALEFARLLEGLAIEPTRVAGRAASTRKVEAAVERTLTTALVRPPRASPLTPWAAGALLCAVLLALPEAFELWGGRGSQKAEDARPERLERPATAPSAVPEALATVDSPPPAVALAPASPAASPEPAPRASAPREAGRTPSRRPKRTSAREVARAVPAAAEPAPPVVVPHVSEPEPAPARLETRAPALSSGTEARTTPRPESARGVIEVAHRIERGSLEVRVDGKTVARVRIGGALGTPAGRPAIASFVAEPGERRVDVLVTDTDRPLAAWTWIGAWEPGQFQARRLELRSMEPGAYELGTQDR